jgi:hypothetical protein
MNLEIEPPSERAHRWLLACGAFGYVVLAVWLTGSVLWP